MSWTRLSTDLVKSFSLYMQIEVPKCELLSFAGLRDVLVGLSKGLFELQNSHNEFSVQVNNELCKRPTFQEHSVGQETGLGVGFIVLKQEVQGLARNLGELGDRNSQCENEVGKLIGKVHQSIVLTAEKCAKSDRKSEKALKYFRRLQCEGFRRQRRKLIFQKWATHSKNNKNSRNLLKTLLKTRHSQDMKMLLAHWKQNAKSSVNAQLKETMRIHTEKLATLSTVQEPARTTEKTVEFASKADLRTLFQDIKSIVLSLETVKFI